MRVLQREVRTDVGTVYIHLDNYDLPTPGGDCRVIDGDTIVAGNQRWRLYGFDAPEIGGGKAHGHPHCDKERDLGLRAKARLEQLIVDAARQGSLRVEILRARCDRHGRHLVRLSVGERNVGDILIAEGLAVAYYGEGPRSPFCDCNSRITEYQAQMQTVAEKEERRALKRGTR